MKFQRIEDAIATCASHLDASSARGTAIENLLVSYLLVLICAEYEMCLAKLLQMRAARISDVHLLKVLNKWVTNQTKRMAIRDLSECLKQLGDDYRDDFSTRVQVHATAHLSWNNIQTNRHAVAHSTGVGVTLNELDGFFKDSQAVLIAVAEGLGFTATEIAVVTWP